MSAAQKLLSSIDDASDDGALRIALHDAAAVTAAAFRHTPVLELAAGWSRLQRHAVATAVRLVPGTAGMSWAWFVSGSVARGEAAPGSDVESMLVLGDDVDDAEKATMLLRAAEVHAVLERCGVGGDANGVLASRPRFCRRMCSWTEGVTRWADDPGRPRGVVMPGLRSAATAVAASTAVSADALRAPTVAAVGRSPAMRRALLQDATALRAHFPSRLRALAHASDVVDVKLAAIDPAVKIARWAALAAGVDATSTPSRIAAAAAAGTLDADDAATLAECFAFLTGFRWRSRLHHLTDGHGGSDVVALSDLAPQDRAALRSAAREIAGISRKLSYLGTFS